MFTVLGNETLVIDKERVHDDLYGEYLDNRWSLEEIDAILCSIKGTWTIDEYKGFIPITLYFEELFDYRNAMEIEQKDIDSLYEKYEQSILSAQEEVPEIIFSIKEDWWGNDVSGNYILANGNQSPISLILSTERLNDYYPVFKDRTTYSDSFSVEYPVLYIMFFSWINAEEKYEKMTLVITADNQFFLLYKGAFYSLKEVSN